MREEESIVKFSDKIPLSFSVIKFDSVFLHMHSNPQLIIVLDGEFDVQIEEENFHAKENDVFIINQRVFHQMRSNSETLILSVLIDQYGFALDQKEADNLHFNLNSMKQGSSKKHDNIRYLVNSIVKFNTMENINSIYTNRAIAYSLFAQLMNDFKSDITDSNQKQASYDTITKITAYINDNYDKKLSLQELSIHFNYSIAYLSRLFKQSLGNNFIDYYDSLRINYSLNDLVYSNKSIEDLSIIHGFENSRSYVRAFKKIYDVYPSEYRKKHQTNNKNDSYDPALLKKESLDKILEQYDTFIYKNENKEKVRDVENIVNIDLDDSKIDLFCPQLNLLSLKTTKYIFYDEIKNSLIQIQKDIGFKHITLTNLFDEELRLYIKKDKEYILNHYLLDSIIEFLSSINIYPYFKFEYQKQMNLAGFEGAINQFVLHLKKKYSPKILSNFYLSITYVDFKDNIILSNSNNYTKSYLDIYKNIKNEIKSIKLGAPTFYKNDIETTSVFFDFVNFIKINNIELDFFPINYLSKDEYYLQKNKDELKEFINYLKENNLFFEKKMYFENINFTNQNNLLNDTLYASNYLCKNLIDNIKSIGSYSKNIFIDKEDIIYNSKNPFKGYPGLVTYNNIKKASYNAYVFFSKLGNKLVKKSNNYIVTVKENDVAILINNYNHYADLYANNEYYEITENNRYICFPKSTNIHFKFDINNLESKNVIIKKSFISKNSGSAYDKSLAIGDINLLTKEELNSLNKLSDINFELERRSIKEKSLHLDITIAPLETILIEIFMN